MKTMYGMNLLKGCAFNSTAENLHLFKPNLYLLMPAIVKKDIWT